MKIGSKYKFGEAQARHWDQFAQAAGLSKAQARKRILTFAKSMPTSACELLSDRSRSYTRHGVVEQLVILMKAKRDMQDGNVFY